MKQVMIVDDSTTMLVSLEGMLTKAGYGVVKAGGGTEALKILQGGTKPDLLITDLNMPDMDGLTLIKHTRQEKNFRFMPILMLTTESQQKKRAEAKAAGATGWLVKPVMPDQLLGVIKKVVPGA